VKRTASYLIAATIAACSAGPAAAQEPPDLVEAKRLYEAAEFQKAVSLLHHAVQALEPQRQMETARVQLADAYLHLGLAYCAIGSAEAGKDAFRGLLRIDRDRRLDPEIYAPKIVDVFERARMSMPAEVPSPVVLAAAPRPTRTPPPHRRFGVELHSQNLALGRRRQPHPDLPVPLEILQRLDSEPAAYDPIVYAEGVRADLRLPGRWGRLEVDYWSGESSRRAFASDGSSIAEPNGSGYIRFDDELSSLHTLSTDSVSLTWSKMHTEKGRLKLRRELGYRFRQVEQEIDDRYDASTAGAVTTHAEYRAASRIRTHGLSVGLDGEIWIAGRWFFDANAGLTLYVGRERARRRGAYEVPVGSSNRFWTDPYTTSSYFGTYWDVSGQVRFEMGRGVYLIAGYAWRDAPDIGPVIEWGMGGHGRRIALGWRFGSPS
jgi:hypothetical protein